MCKKIAMFFCLVFCLSLSVPIYANTKRGSNSTKSSSAQYNNIFFEEVSTDQLKEKMFNKESFVFYAGLLNCKYCKKFDRYHDKQFIAENITVFRYNLDRDKENYDANKNILKKFFPNLKSAPTIYYISEGEVVHELKYSEDRKLQEIYIKDFLLTTNLMKGKK